jgi:putative hemolysin
MRPNGESKMRRASGLIFVAILLMAPQSAWALANPASVFCAKSGGKTEIRKGPRGQYGVCRLPDGRVVDEWAYFRAMRAKRPH